MSISDLSNLSGMTMFYATSNVVKWMCCVVLQIVDHGRPRQQMVGMLSNHGTPYISPYDREAHVIGDWGASIIPTFQLLPMIKNQLLFRNRDLRVLLLSATISVEEEAELITLFHEGLHLPALTNGSYAIRHSKARLGLVFDVESPVSKDGDEDSFDEQIIQLMRRKKSQIPPRWQYKSDGLHLFTFEAACHSLHIQKRKGQTIERRRIRLHCEKCIGVQDHFIGRMANSNRIINGWLEPARLAWVLTKMMFGWLDISASLAQGIVPVFWTGRSI